MTPHSLRTMGNLTNRDQWAAQERLRFIERQAWWRGAVNRRDLQELFGISPAQASADLQAYLQLNPEALAYNLSAKRYEARAEMVCRLQQPDFDEAVVTILGGQHGMVRGPAAPGEAVDRVLLPLRTASDRVARHLFLAIVAGRRLGARYWSVKREKASQRHLRPHAFGHDGYRWHVRAWCEEREDFRDFVMSRFERVDWPGEQVELPRRDVDWETLDEVVVRANRELAPSQRKAIERDYGMQKGKLRMVVRRAMKSYLLAHLRLDETELPRHLEMAK